MSGWLSSFSFASPWVMLALVLLPVIWRLIRSIPPAPRVRQFPAVTFLMKVSPSTETVLKAPLWLILLRLFAVAVFILALSQPTYHPNIENPVEGSAVFIMENSWSSAHNFEIQKQRLKEKARAVHQNGYNVSIVTTAPSEDGFHKILLDSFSAARTDEFIEALTPYPWKVDYSKVGTIMKNNDLIHMPHIVWLHDGILHEKEKAFYRLVRDHPDLVITGPGVTTPRILKMQNDSHARGLSLIIKQLPLPFEQTVTVQALAESGTVLAAQEIKIASKSDFVMFVLEMPQQMRNAVTAIRIAENKSAAAVWYRDTLLSEPKTGVLKSAQKDFDTPFEDEHYFLNRAADAFSQKFTGDLQSLMEAGVTTLLVASSEQIPEATIPQLKRWIEQGGIFIKFADDTTRHMHPDLLPVSLRPGTRQLGGTFSWNKPLSLAPFDSNGLFSDVTSKDSVLVKQHVIPEPSAETQTLATLEDGTPLITAKQIAQGWSVLFHVPTRMEWSTLPVSGVFVQLLERLSHLGSSSYMASKAQTLPPYQVLNGYGKLNTPKSYIESINQQTLIDFKVSPRLPPGLYGNKGYYKALNLGQHLEKPLPSEMTLTDISALKIQQSYPLMPPLLILTLLLLLLDYVLTLYLRGYLSLPKLLPLKFMALVILLPGLATAQPSGQPPAPDLPVYDLHLGYVRTGIASVDDKVANGMAGISKIISSRTAVELARPHALNLNTDDIIFYPLVYWPLAGQSLDLSEPVRTKVRQYLNSGGLILFDIYDNPAPSLTTSPALRILEQLQIYTIKPIMVDHTMTKSFYLMQQFPGRYHRPPVYVETSETSNAVSRIVLGQNHWAEAWAVDASGRSLYPVIPGGEKQREQSFRFGINLIMYALTGNYKSDQVHIKAVMERMGQ